MNEKYRDILTLPHHVSETHAPLTMRARAAQFAPFAALKGYDALLKESEQREAAKEEPAPLPEGLSWAE